MNDMDIIMASLQLAAWLLLLPILLDKNMKIPLWTSLGAVVVFGIMSVCNFLIGNVMVGVMVALVSATWIFIAWKR